MPEPGSTFTVLFRRSEESWSSFVRRTAEVSGESIIVLSSADNTHLRLQEDRDAFLDQCAKVRYRLRVATKEPTIVSAARKRGIRVYDRTRRLRLALRHHTQQEEALRIFSPSLWRQHWRSRLQQVGILSVPRVRIWVLAGASVLVFLFVLLRLLPSADVRVWPRSEVITHTMNILLADSGATLPTAYARVQPLHHITVRVNRSITFDDISPEFTGNDATVPMTVVNASPHPWSLRKGTRVSNQAGMIFRLQDAVVLDPQSEVTVRAKADHLDLYGKVVGQRGNVPANLQWEIPGLSPEDRKLVYAKNPKAGTGGTTAQRSVLQASDLDIGRKRLMQELLVEAKQLVEEERQLRNARDPLLQLELLAKDDVILKTYSGFVLPTQFIGQAVKSVPIEGQLIYSVPAYDLSALRRNYSRELQERTGEGKRLQADTVDIDPQRIIIIEFDDAYAWIKITADVVGTEHSELDPLTPTGVRFAKKVRETIAGLTVVDALRILRNFPEVDKVDIRVWPPWNTLISPIPSNIHISPQQ